MKVEFVEADVLELRRRIAGERNALQRDRCRAVLLAAEGQGGRELERTEIAAILGRSRQFVDEWVGRYRRLGLPGVEPKPSGRRPAKLTAEQQQELMKILDSGPSPESGRSVYFGRDIRLIIKERFGKIYHLNGVYALLHRLDYSHLVPRPRHRQDDPEAREAFKKKRPRRSRRSRRPTPTSGS
jgi:transposase